MLNLFVIDWDEEELHKNIEPFIKEGWNVGYEHDDEIYAKMNIESLKPDVIIIYLTTSPSRGRNAARLIKKEESIKDIPIVFVDGKPKDIKKTKKKHPNAIYTVSNSLNNVLINLQN
jgi:AmiR/NasT family two-component response regulator